MQNTCKWAKQTKPFKFGLLPLFEPMKGTIEARKVS